MLGGEAGGELGVAVDDRLDERRVLLERAPAQRRRVRLGLEAERDLEAQLGGELEQVAVVRRRGDRPVQRFVGGSRRLAGIAGRAVGVERCLIASTSLGVRRCAAVEATSRSISARKSNSTSNSAHAGSSVWRTASWAAGQSNGST